MKGIESSTLLGRFCFSSFFMEMKLLKDEYMQSLKWLLASIVLFSRKNGDNLL